jgi:hypothetical protein
MVKTPSTIEKARTQLQFAFKSTINPHIIYEDNEFIHILINQKNLDFINLIKILSVSECDLKLYSIDSNLRDLTISYIKKGKIKQHFVRKIYG